MRTLVPTLLLAACAPLGTTESVHAPPLEGWALSAAEDAPADDEVDAEDAADDDEASPVTYRLQPRSDGSSLYVIVYNDPSGLASRFGHDHVIAPTTYDGTVTWTEGDPSACDIDISFDVTNLTVDPDAMRQKADLDPGGAVNDSSKETIKENFLGKSQLFARQYPKISYRSTKCVASGDRVDVTGELTIRGVGETLTVPMDVDIDGDTFRASGTFTAEHQDFGFKPYTNLAGALRNKSTLSFVVDVVGEAI